MGEVQLERVTKTYASGITAVKDLDLTVHDGELMVLMGPSGCGKTTTLRLIAGLEAPTFGTIRIGQQIANHLPPNRRDVSMVFQRPALYPHLTVQQNLTFGMRLRKREDREWQAQIAAVVRMFHLEEVLDRKPAQLSGGQQQRVAVGRAIIRQSSVFLLDEPLSNLDASLRSEMRRELHLLHRRFGATMIYVTHDQAEALSLGDRIALLHDGALQQVATPVVIFAQPANRFVAEFIGSPGMNLLEGRLSGDGPAMRFHAGLAALRVPSEIGKQWLRFRERPLTLGIRPENVIMVTRARTASVTAAPLKAIVVLTEPFGDYTLMTLEHEMWHLTARIPQTAIPSSNVAEGQMIEAEIDMAKAHLFDGVTGLALCHPGSG